MRFARKLLLLAGMAIAAMAMTASSASAVEVAQEHGVGALEHCSAITPNPHGQGAGGCLIHAESVTPVELGSALGMILCDNTFEAQVDEAGHGYIYSISLDNCDPTTVEPCAEAAGTSTWEVALTDENTLEADFCVLVGGALPVPCHLAGIHVDQHSHDEVEFSTNGHQFCEDLANSVEGHWIARSDTGTGGNHPPVEIID